jgi:hypothetical protein
MQKSRVDLPPGRSRNVLKSVDCLASVTAKVIRIDERRTWSYNQNLWMHHLIGGAAYLPR